MDAGQEFRRYRRLRPGFVTADELPAGAGGLRLEVFLNGKKMQSANTDDMVFSVAALVSKASEFATLEPGDIIVTGTRPVSASRVSAGVHEGRRYDRSPDRTHRHTDQSCQNETPLPYKKCEETQDDPSCAASRIYCR